MEITRNNGTPHAHLCDFAYYYPVRLRATIIARPLTLALVRMINELISHFYRSPV